MAFIGSKYLNIPIKRRKMTLLKSTFKLFSRIISIVIFLAIACIILFLVFDRDMAKKYGLEHFYEETLSLEEIEKIKTGEFIDASGTYRENLWGNKIIINGTIESTATHTNYKNITIEFKFYGKTDAIIKKERHIVYDYLPSGSVKKFKMEIANVKNFESLGWDAVKADTY